MGVSPPSLPGSGDLALRALRKFYLSEWRKGRSYSAGHLGTFSGGHTLSLKRSYAYGLLGPGVSWGA